ncbi:MAG: hypothetical protein INR71_04495 [Terriglobus roseus]|nr:hypothetical protein [Terriglobus roseus]
MTADRSYRTAMMVPKALTIMREDVGRAFNSACVAASERALIVTEVALRGQAGPDRRL